MDALIAKQLAQREIIQKFFINYKKDGREKRSASYYEKRLRDFQIHWDKFEQGHHELLVGTYSDEAFIVEGVDYFEEDMYSKLEEFFTDSYIVIEERFHREYPPQSVSSPKAPQEDMKIWDNSIKLPRLSLERFSGDYRKWPTFHDLFRTLVHDNKSLRAVQKLQYLKLHLTGEPEHLLRHFQITENNYESAWILLTDRYDNNRVLVNAELKALFSQHAVIQESSNGIKGLLDTTQECLQALSNLQIDIQGWDPMMVYLIVQKLPPESHHLWEQKISDHKDIPTWEELKRFLESRFRTLEAVTTKKFIQHDQKNNQRSSFGERKQSPRSFHVAATVVCTMCGEGHNLRHCSKFGALTPEKRFVTVKEKRLCINCLGSGHMLMRCPSKQKCYHCRRSHHSLLHRETMPASGTNAKHPPTQDVAGGSHVSATHGASLSITAPEYTPSTENGTVQGLNSFIISQTPEDEILLATALLKMVAPSGEEHIVRALIDQGSQASFISEFIVQDLKLRKEAINASISGIGQMNAGQVHSRVKFTLKAINGDERYETTGFVLKRLTSLLPARTLQNREWKHVEGLQLADPHFYQSNKIDILLGADMYSRIMLDGVRRGGVGEPIAQKTVFGWILCGETNGSEDGRLNINNFHVELDKQLKLFWELEEIPTRSRLSEEEKKCEEHFAQTYKRLPCGRYEVELPLEEEAKGNQLGRSRFIAVSRLHQMEARFRRDPQLKQEYQGCLREYITLGHMERVSGSEECFRQEVESGSYYSCCYLPHHGVIKQSSSTTKLRVVFDASKATKSGVSLNDRMMKGPVIQQELATLLIRWRKHQIAFMADLEKMYRQIRIKSNHADYQRIVWRESSEATVEDYRLLTVTFGTKSAPYLATRVIQQLAKDERNNFPLGSKIAEEDFYVDDLISGADDVETALKIQGELIGLMTSGCFSLRKWASNSPKILEAVSLEHREINLPLDIKDGEGIRALGIRWNPAADTFSYSLNMEMTPSKWTKRSILSEISKLFDPIGWLTPSTLFAKLMMRRLWLEGLSWDEKVTPELEQEWLKYRTQIKDIEEIHINRWTQFSEADDAVELHGFSDASMDAYAAVVYMCTTNAKGKRHVTLLAAKSKVAPIKTVSIARLELCGAVLLAKLIKYVTKALNIGKQIETCTWTDSEIVIAWLRSHPSRWTTFVANRVSIIHEVLGENSWHYVPSAENPADCASRGMYPEELKNHKLWWAGPDWLAKERERWPTQKQGEEIELEKRKIKVHHTGSLSDNLEMKFSTLTRLLRVTAYALRFINNCRKPKSERQDGYLKASETKQALNTWIKITQRLHFVDEIRSLEHKRAIHGRSKVLKLNPFIDTNGLLRAGGRIRNSDLSYSEKFPIILPDKCNLTQLIIRKVHQDTLHGGSQLMMNIIAKNYWILNARNTIRSLVQRCVLCWRQKAQTRTQLMADLPRSRVQINRPFSHAGVDYCGPFELKMHKGKKANKYKAYIALFVCMTTKAIHLELVTDLTAEGFIAAFRRFVSRRGSCTAIYCDCGTNFIGASRILSSQYKQLAHQINHEIAEVLEGQGTEFHFNPPSSPHFGGLWEAGVRSTKHHLKRILGITVLTYEEFTTILTQIEGCLNSRPLSEISRDPNDLKPLTPGHFLIGEAILTPPEPSLLNLNVNSLDRWQYLQRLYQDFWKRWNSEYLSRLQLRPKWTTRTKNVEVGDLVIIKEENLPPCRWLLARIIETHPGQDGLVRVVTLKTKDNILKRPIAKICRLPVEPPNSELK